MAVLTNYESGGSFDNLAYGSRESQGFKIPNNASVTSVSFKMSKGSTATASTITISITSGSENGTVVKTENFSTSLLQSYDGATTSWTEFTFTTPVSLTAGTQYWARHITSGGSANGDEIRRSLHFGGTYADGAIWFSGVENTSYDALFRVSGNVETANKDAIMFGHFA